MNVYVVTEGKVESVVYRCWVPFVNSCLRPVDDITAVNNNQFYIVEGPGYPGYPGYFDTIERAILDVNQFEKFDRLVISVDSEEMTRQEKHDEIKDFVAEKRCRVEIKIVVQHFCFETWALGNRKIIRQHPESGKLKGYMELFDVTKHDPELLPRLPDKEWNRAQFAEQYLRHAINDRNPRLTYTKRNPKALLSEKYFDQVKNRQTQTTHIASFADFMRAFQT